MLTAAYWSPVGLKDAVWCYEVPSRVLDRKMPETPGRLRASRAVGVQAGAGAAALQVATRLNSGWGESVT